MSSKPPISLAARKAFIVLDRVSRTYWHCASALEYAARWWSTIPQAEHPLVLKGYAGDDTDPFRRVKCSPDEFSALGPSIVETVREDAIVSFVATFERYLYEVCQRAVFLRPQLCEDSDLKFSAKTLAPVIADDNPRAWFAREIADKYIRGKNHCEMVSRLSGMLQLGIAKDDPKVVQWGRWELLRNAIVHTARRTSRDLCEGWRQRFQSEGTPLQLADEDITGISALAREVIELVDRRFVSETVGKSDAELLVRESYVRYNHDDPAGLSRRAYSLLRVRMTKECVSRVLAKQRESQAPVLGYDFSEVRSLLESKPGP